MSTLKRQIARWQRCHKIHTFFGRQWVSKSNCTWKWKKKHLYQNVVCLYSWLMYSAISGSESTTSSRCGMHRRMLRQLVKLVHFCEHESLLSSGILQGRQSCSSEKLLRSRCYENESFYSQSVKHFSKAVSEGIRRKLKLERLIEVRD